MFQLHDITRRKLAIACFILLCLLPTCAVAGWCLWRNMPWETQFAAERLQQQLGWKVKLERLEHPRPGTDVYKNLELADPETGQPFFSCQSVKVSHKQITDPQELEKPPLTLSFEQPEIDAAALDQISRLIERVVQEQFAPSIDCEISLVEMNLRRGKTMQAFPIEAGVKHSDGCVQAAMRFSLPNANEATSVVLRLYRNRTVLPPQNSFVLETSESEMSWEQIISEIPEFAKLGLKLDYKIKNNTDGHWYHYLISSVVR
jgi:hypothetical protein